MVQESARLSLTDDLKAIETLREQELHAFNTGDAKSYLSLLTDDIVFDSWNRPAVVGIEASRGLMGILFSKADFYATYNPEDVVVSGDFAFDRGLWYERMTLKSNGEETNDVYGTLQIYARGEDGRWRLARSIWNKE